MTEFILNHDPAIRLSIFLGILVAMVWWEFVAPRRVLILARPSRWTANLGIVFLNGALLRVVFPAGAVGVAAFATGQGWGLFNHFAFPYAAAVLLSVIALDFAIYLQHVMFHAVPALWRLHRMHHADLDFDVTTGVRFHPIEIVLSMLIKFAVIVVLGAPVLAVIVFEVLLNATAMFNHSNVRIPLVLDRIIRWLVVTPDMHRVHHSILGHETNSNFGFNLPLWDRLLGTYRDQPERGHEKMTIGIRDFREPKQADRLDSMLMIPFRGKVTGYAINRREWKSPK
ncbi:MAG: sterol desaturase family protein [Gammaproteobacteria bacterium]|nr:sterol desaturase family protein [Gammaproteobacteria bacterium]